MDKRILRLNKELEAILKPAEAERKKKHIEADKKWRKISDAALNVFWKRRNALKRQTTIKGEKTI